MQYRPIFVVYYCISKYLTEEQLECIRIELAKYKRPTKKSFLSIISKHFDINILLMKPMIPEDAMVYNYLVYEPFTATKLISHYERVVIIPVREHFNKIVNQNLSYESHLQVDNQIF
jgi:hypothetical protein